MSDAVVRTLLTEAKAKLDAASAILDMPQAQPTVAVAPAVPEKKKRNISKARRAELAEACRARWEEGGILRVRKNAEDAAKAASKAAKEASKAARSQPTI